MLAYEAATLLKRTIARNVHNLAPEKGQTVTDSRARRLSCVSHVAKLTSFCSCDEWNSRHAIFDQIKPPISRRSNEQCEGKGAVEFNLMLQCPLW